MDNIVGKKSSLSWAVNISVTVLVILWLIPTIGLLVSSFRTADQISTSGWWKGFNSNEQNIIVRTANPQTQKIIDGKYVIEGMLFSSEKEMTISVWGVSSRAIDGYIPGETAKLTKGGEITLREDGHYRMINENPFTGSRGIRVFVTAPMAPEFTLDNYRNVLFDPKNVDGMGKAFLSTLIVAIPATIIPILIAAFAAYALAWMQFPGRALLVAFVVGLLVVPLQMALVPLLKLHMHIGIGKGFLGVWLAHTGFGLPLAIYLLRNYMIGLPKDIIENARIDGASDFKIFMKLILPLSFPALAAFSIFQFLWTWNDLLVAKVFLIDSSGQTEVMTSKLVELLGSRGGNWEILATSAFVSIVVPLIVFFALQKYLVRGLLTGAIK